MNLQAAVVGAMAINAIYLFQGSFVATAAWGWRSADLAQDGFTCSQGNIGCDGPTDCTADKYTCTVTPKSGKSCNVGTTTMKCSKQATPTDLFQPNEGACINKGGGSFTKDSSLQFDPAPVCTDAAAKDIVATASATGNHGVLAEALTKAKLVTALQGTVFAPTDAAFTAALTTLGITKQQLLDRADLADILKYHVISGSKIMAADLKATQTPTTLEGQKVTITKDGSGVKFAAAKVTTADVDCSNGVIHVIDGVVLPPAKKADEGDKAVSSNGFHAKGLASVAWLVMSVLSCF